MIERKRCNDLTGKEWLQNSFSIWRGLSKSKEEKEFRHPASFPVSLCEKLIRTFSRGDSIVLDPFNGIGSSMVACKNLNHEGVGIDLSEEFCNIAMRRIGDDQNIKIIAGNSFKILPNFHPEYFDLCLTSPPYWDILNMKRTADIKNNVSYSDSQDDLGNIDDYDLFLDTLIGLFSNIYRVLKKDSYCVVNVMDIRKKNKFYPLHSDLALRMKTIGYIFDDIIIWDRQTDYNNMRPLGYPSRFRINKVHEYLLIFIK